MRRWAKVWVGSCLIAAVPLAWADPSAELFGSDNSQSQDQGHQAVGVYNAGVELMKQADQLDAAAPTQGSGAAAANQGAAHDAYAKARDKFQQATQQDPNMPEAWNNLGYTLRKLGDYQASLAAYEHALALRPGYPQALEYRGETYLHLNRLDDAKQTYMRLFDSDRAIAAQFLSVIQNWIALQKRGPSSVDAHAVTDLEKWAQERSQIAAETAALTRAGTAASWH